MAAGISILIVHGVRERLDELADDLTAAGLAVTTALTRRVAISKLQTEEFTVVVTPWDGAGSQLYRWALENKYHLRARFVFLAEHVPDDFEQSVGGRCVCVNPRQPVALRRAVLAIA